MEKDIAQRFIEQEARILMLEERCEAQELVLAWLLKNQPEDAGYWFLSSQANEFDQPEHREKYPASIALLDHLRTLLSLSSVDSAAVQATQPETPTR